MLESQTVEVVKNPESEPEVVTELVSLQERILSWPTAVVELPIETFVDLSIKLTMDLVPTLAAMSTSFFLRSPDVYDSL